MAIRHEHRHQSVCDIIEFSERVFVFRQFKQVSRLQIDEEELKKILTNSATIIGDTIYFTAVPEYDFTIARYLISAKLDFDAATCTLYTLQAIDPALHWFFDNNLLCTDDFDDSN